MANPSGNHQEQQAHVPSSSFNGNSVPESSSGGGGGAPLAAVNMKHNPGISLDWTPEEQAILEDGLSKLVIFQFPFFFSVRAYVTDFHYCKSCLYV